MPACCPTPKPRETLRRGGGGGGGIMMSVINCCRQAENDAVTAPAVADLRASTDANPAHPLVDVLLLAVIQAVLPGK